jgi:hypothetical protein
MRSESPTELAYTQDEAWNDDSFVETVECLLADTLC